MVTVKDVTFRCKDDQPYYDQTMQNDKMAKIEPVYVSPHFDLRSQLLVDPLHLDEVIAEVEFNKRLKKFD